MVRPRHQGDVHQLPTGTFQSTITVAAPAAGNSPRTVQVTLIVEDPAARADIDKDGDVDQSDFGLLQACLKGAGVAQNAPECQAARVDGDSDVDVDDVNILLGCFSGANVPYDPDCVD